MDKTLQMLIRENELLTKLIHLNEEHTNRKLEQLQTMYDALAERIAKQEAKTASASAAEPAQEVDTVVGEVVKDIVDAVVDSSEAEVVVPKVQESASLQATQPTVPTVSTSSCFCRICAN